MKIKLFSAIITIFGIALVLTSIPQVNAEGGGGLECPTTSSIYNFLNGSSTYEITPFEEGDLGILFCEYMTTPEHFEETEPFAQITAIYHISGDLSQNLIDEYGCGAILGEQYSPIYVSSETHFASVAFSAAHLVEAASQIMTQIEDQNFATLCSQQEIGNGGESVAEEVKESVEEHEVIEDTSIEITIKEIEEESIETIIEKIQEDAGKEQKSKTPDVVLPDWIKNNAEWWSTDQITQDDFSLGIEFMIKEGFIKLPPTEVAEQTSNEIPGWVKNNAGWWADGMISDVEFVNGLQFLIKNGIIVVA